MVYPRAGSRRGWVAASGLTRYRTPDVTWAAILNTIWTGGRRRSGSKWRKARAAVKGGQPPAVGALVTSPHEGQGSNGRRRCCTQVQGDSPVEATGVSPLECDAAQGRVEADDGGLAVP